MAISLLVAACTSGGGSSEAPESEAPPASQGAASEAPDTTFRIGYSNGGGVGNGFRE
jgi:hypothetical protein